MIIDEEMHDFMCIPCILFPDFIKGNCSDSIQGQTSIFSHTRNIPDFIGGIGISQEVRIFSHTLAGSIPYCHFHGSSVGIFF